MMRFGAPEDQRPHGGRPLSAHLVALLVGIDAYPHPSLPPLHGCVNDVDAMRRCLVEGYGVPPDNVLVLTDEDATREGIEDAFRNHLEAAAERWEATAGAQPPGFLFFFSGHGSQADDPTGIEIDGLDETLVPFDGREDDVFDIKDFELASWLARLPGDDVTVVLDCCHSGSGTRSWARDAGAARAAPPDTRPQPASRPPSLGPTRGVSVQGGGDHVLLAACADHQQAFEYHGAPDGVVRGRFSYFLTQQLAAVREEPDPVTYRDLHDRVWLDVAADSREQRPQCEGDVDRVLFGTERLERAAAGHVLGTRRGLVWIDVGRVHGVLPGSRLVVSGADGAEATVEVERVEPVRCAGPLVAPRSGEAPSGLEQAAVTPAQPGSPPPLRGRRARLLTLQLGPHRWRLSSDAGADDALRAATSPSEPLAGLVDVVAGSADADLRVAVDGTTYELLDADGRWLATAQDPASLVAVVTHVARYAWLLELGRDTLGPDLAGDLTLTPLVIGSDRFSGETTVDRPQPVADGTYELEAGQQLAFELHNGTRLPLQVGLLAFTADWHLSVLHPVVRGAQDRLPAGRTVVIGQDGTSFETSVPEGVPHTLDRVRLIGTTHPTSFEVLAADPPDARWGVAGPLPVPPGGRPDPPAEPLLPRRGRRAPSRWLTTTIPLLTRRPAS